MVQQPRRPTHRNLRRAVAVALGAIAVLGVFAAPAGAHGGGGGIAPTNYESVLTELQPAPRGVTVRVADLGTTLRLTNTGSHDVVVLGYEGEPYLRVGPRGVFENRRSPAVTINRSVTAPRAPPPSADADAPPHWQRVSDGDTVSWHDHRTHFMGSRNPPVVRDDPDQRHVVDRWVVPLRVDGRVVSARGELVWSPPPPVWPSVLLAGAVGAVVVALSRTRRWRAVLAVSLGALVACAVAHVVSTWGATTASTGTDLGESAYSIAGILLGLAALVWMWRRGAAAATPFALVAAVFLLLAGGLADIPTLAHSQVASTMSPAAVRVVVALTIGLGAGVAGAAALRLREPSPSPAPSAAPAPPSVTS